MAGALDVEAELVAYFGAAGIRTFATLPPAFDTELPVVRVVELPARERARAWNGPALIDERSIDVDVFDVDDGATADTATAVRALVESIDVAGLVLTSAPVFTRRPDWNHNTRRRGAVLSFVTK